MVFENLFVFHSQEAEITELLLLLMQDSQLEVCEAVVPHVMLCSLCDVLQVM